MLLLIILLLLAGCSKSEVVSIPTQMEIRDTTYTPRSKSTDTTKRYPIQFDIHITDWEDVEVNK